MAMAEARPRADCRVDAGDSLCVADRRSRPDAGDVAGPYVDLRRACATQMDFEARPRIFRWSQYAFAPDPVGEGSLCNRYLLLEQHGVVWVVFLRTKIC